MQKFGKYILLVVFLLTAISGCSVQNKIPDIQIPTKFESDFNANFGTLELSGHISKFETGMYTFSITSPKTLDGINFNCVGNKITADINGIGFEADTQSLPSASFVKSVVNSLDTISKSSSVTATKTDGYNKYSASSQSGNFFILQECNSGNIVSLAIENADISVNFIDFKTK